MGIVSSHLSEKEADDRDQADDRYEEFLRYEEFMKGGPCKEIYMNYQTCMYKTSNSKKLDMCIDAHSDYYQPVLDLYKSMMKFCEERMEKDIVHSDTPIDEVNDEEAEKFIAALMEDSCKESFTDWAVNCALSDDEANLILPVSLLEKKKKNNEEVNCEKLSNLFMECIDAHPDHSFYAVKKATEEHIDKEFKALFP